MRQIDADTRAVSRRQLNSCEQNCQFASYRTIHSGCLTAPATEQHGFSLPFGTRNLISTRCTEIYPQFSPTLLAGLPPLPPPPPPLSTRPDPSVTSPFRCSTSFAFDLGIFFRTVYGATMNFARGGRNGRFKGASCVFFRCPYFFPPFSSSFHFSIPTTEPAECRADVGA